MKVKKCWREKLADDKDLPKVVPIPARLAKTWGKGTLVIPAPHEVDAPMRKVPKGKLVTINELRAALARQHKATMGCPMTTGIFAWIAAGAAAEDEAAGKKRVTPYWRTLKSGGELNPKYPGGVKEQTKRLVSEGHRIITKGTKTLVEEYDKSLAKM